MKLCSVVALAALTATVVGCSHERHHKKHHEENNLKPAATQPANVAPRSEVPAPAAAVAAVPAASTTVVTAGAPITLTGEAVPVSAVLADPEKYAGHPIKISGNVSSVCQKKGCWARLADDKTPAGEDLFVKFDCPESDDGRVLPLSVKGNPAVVEGTVKVTEMSEAKARHYAKDAGKSDEEVAKIVGPQKQVTVLAPSVRVDVK